MIERALSTSRVMREDLHLKFPTHRRNVEGLLPPLEAIVSGGQTGADQAGLRAARALHLATGGFAPLGFRTLDGPCPQLGSLYGLVECGRPDYSHRTARNVFAADATVRFAADFDTPGEICTLRAITKYKRPYLDLHVSDLDRLGPEFIVFLVRHDVHVLNVAGNSEQTTPGIGTTVERFLVGSVREAWAS